MAKTIRVQAFKKGGVPRRRVGEVFDAPTDEKGKLRADYAVFCRPVDPETPTGRVSRRRAEPPQYRKVRGRYVAEGGEAEVSGGGCLPAGASQPDPDADKRPETPDEDLV